MENIKVKSSDLQFIKNDVNAIVKELGDLNNDLNSKFNTISATDLYIEGLNNIISYVNELTYRYDASIGALEKFENDISTTEDYYSNKFKDILVPNIDGVKSTNVQTSNLNTRLTTQDEIENLLDKFSDKDVKVSTMEDNYIGAKEQIGSIINKENDKEDEKVNIKDNYYNMIGKVELGDILNGIDRLTIDIDEKLNTIQTTTDKSALRDIVSDCKLRIEQLNDRYNELIRSDSASGLIDILNDYEPKISRLNDRYNELIFGSRLLDINNGNDLKISNMIDNYDGLVKTTKLGDITNAEELHKDYLQDNYGGIATPKKMTDITNDNGLKISNLNDNYNNTISSVNNLNNMSNVNNVKNSSINDSFVNTINTVGYGNTQLKNISNNQIN